MRAPVQLQFSSRTPNAFNMMVLTAKFGCARLLSRIMCADVDGRRLNLQACYAEYQWIIAYAQKHNVQIFQEELALCREMVIQRVPSAPRAASPSLSLTFLSFPFSSLFPFPSLPFLSPFIPPHSLPSFTSCYRRPSFPRKSPLCPPTAPCTLHRAADGSGNCVEMGSC